MLRSLLFFTLVFLISVKAQAQDTTASAAAPEDTKRYLGMVEFGYLYGKRGGSAGYAVASPTVQVFNGVRVHRLLAVGATVGFDFYDNVLVTPFALGVRGELGTKRVIPYYSLNAGYGSAWLNSEEEQRETRGGWMYNPALGIRVKAGNYTAFTVGAGYKYQRVAINYNWWGNHVAEKISYKRLVLQMGFMF